jgi:single-stranded-DNA-specific exonuclease
MVSVKGMSWRIREEDPALARSLSEELGIPPLLSRLLVARGFLDKDSAHSFLNPYMRDLHDPSLMSDMDKASCRIAEAVSSKERIMVHGDYDADGLTSTALMVRFLRSAGADVVHHIPSRLEDGYGLSMKAVDRASKEGVSLIITVDCGIKAVEPVDYAHEKGIDVIVTDHHEQGKDLPKAYAVVDPKQDACPYPFKELAGVGVAYKLASKLFSLGIGLTPNNHLDLVAVGTISDIVPLVGENRILVSAGLEVLKDTDSAGFRALMLESSIDPFMGVRSQDVAFKLSPRLNAVGRLGDPAMALELMLTNDRIDAELFSREMNALNFRRKALGSKVYEEAISMARDPSYEFDRFLVLHSDSWHPGVIGVAASRLAEETGKPSLVLAVEGGKAKGSCRSPAGIDVVEAMEFASDLLLEHGGHENAVGVSLLPENIPLLRTRLNAFLSEVLPGEELSPICDVDLVVDGSDLNIEGVDSLNAIEPTGSGNGENVVCLKEARVLDVSTVGDGEHLKLKLSAGDRIVGCIWFRMGHLADAIRSGNLVNAAGNVSVHRWGGREDIQLRLVDLEIL